MNNPNKKNTESKNKIDVQKEHDVDTNDKNKLEKVLPKANKINTKKNNEVKNVVNSDKLNTDTIYMDSNIKKEEKANITKDNQVFSNKQREEQSAEYEKFISDSGLPIAFQIIYSELITKNIQQDNYFTYTAMRLRQIGKELEDIKSNIR